jgi:hypothetical protein
LNNSFAIFFFLIDYKIEMTTLSNGIRVATEKTNH